MVFSILKFFTQLSFTLFKRGKGVFKILFFVDNFIRLFAMTLLIPIFFRWLNWGNFLVSLGFILGAIIDIEDFVSSMGLAKFQEWNLVPQIYLNNSRIGFLKIILLALSIRALILSNFSW